MCQACLLHDNSKAKTVCFEKKKLRSEQYRDSALQVVTNQQNDSHCTYGRELLYNMAPSDYTMAPSDYTTWLLRLHIQHGCNKGAGDLTFDQT